MSERLSADRPTSQVTGYREELAKAKRANVTAAERLVRATAYENLVFGVFHPAHPYWTAEMLHEPGSVPHSANPLLDPLRGMREVWWQ